MAGRKPQSRVASTIVYEKLTQAYLLAMISVFLLFSGFHGYESIADDKKNLLFILSYGFVGLMLILRLELAFVYGVKLDKPRDLVKEVSLPHVLLIAYWFFAILSTLFSISPKTSFYGGSRGEGLLTVTIYVICALLVAIYYKPDKTVLVVMGVAAVLEALIILAQLIGANPLGMYPQGMTFYDGNKLYSGQFAGTIGNTDTVSAVLSILIPVFWISLLRLKSKSRLLLLFPLLMCVVCMIKLSVASGILGVFFSTVIMIVVLMPSRKARAVAGLTVFAAISLGCLGLYFFGGRSTGTIYEAYQVLHGHIEDNYGSGRIFIWKNVLPLIYERPILGGGLDTLGLRMTATFSRTDDDLAMTLVGTIDSAHNEYLGILVNQGILSLLVYLALLVSVVKQCLCQLSNDVKVICLGALISYAIQSFFNISSPISSIYLFIVLAIMMGKQTTGGEEHGSV